MRKAELTHNLMKLRQTVPFPVDRNDLFFSLFPSELERLVGRRTELLPECRNLNAVFPSEREDRVYVQMQHYDPFWFHRVGGPAVSNTVIKPLVLTASNPYYPATLEWFRAARELEDNLVLWAQYARDHHTQFRTHVGGKRRARPDEGDKELVEIIDEALVTASMLGEFVADAWVMSPLI